MHLETQISNSDVISSFKPNPYCLINFCTLVCEDSYLFEKVK